MALFATSYKKGSPSAMASNSVFNSRSCTNASSFDGSCRCMSKSLSLVHEERFHVCIRCFRDSYVSPCFSAMDAAYESPSAGILITLNVRSLGLFGTIVH